MGKVLIKDTTLTDIANAIRTKDGSTAKMYPREMAGKIKNISTSSIGARTPISIKYITNSTTINGKGTICLNSFSAITIDGTTITSEKVGGKVNNCRYQLEFKTTVRAPRDSIVILY